MLNLTPPRHTPTLREADTGSRRRHSLLRQPRLAQSVEPRGRTPLQPAAAIIVGPLWIRLRLSALRQPQDHVAVALARATECQEPVDKLAIEPDPHPTVRALGRRGLIDPGFFALRAS